MKICTVVGTRPEIIKLSRVIAELDKACEHILIHTGQNYDYELNEIFFEEMGIRKPDFFLDAARESSTKSVASMMYTLDAQLSAIKPDAVLILGDTNSCVAAAYAAKRLKIPLMHMEAGNRCFDERVPEEVNRRIVDQLSDINLPYSNIARENLLHDGLPSDRIIKTGSPQNEVLSYYNEKICASKILEDLGLTRQEYFLVNVHREENTTPEKLKEFADMLARLSWKHPDKRIILSVHPRLRKLLDSDTLVSNIELHKPFGFLDYNKLQMGAYCVLSDSGTITEESVLNSFPALNLRETHERPEGMEQAAVMMTGFKNAVACIPIAIAHYPALIPDDYSHLNVSQKVVRIILSYTDYVRRNVWKIQ